jgi:hypothetical protein
MRKTILFFTMLVLATTAFSAENRWQLDSTVNNTIINRYHYKHEYTYNNKGNLISNVRWGSSNGNDWGKIGKDEYNYDSIGNKISWTNYVWEWKSNEWTVDFKFEYDYSNNNEISRIRYDWDRELDDWKKFIKAEYTYNNNNRTKVSYFWRNELNDWEMTDITEFTYNNNGNEILLISYYCSNDLNNLNNQKSVTTYDDKGNKIFRVTYFWDKEQNNWDPFSIQEYTCDSNSNQILEINYSWDKERNNWRTSWKLENTYDNNGNQASYSEYGWREDKWILFCTKTYYYSSIPHAGAAKKYNTEIW